MVQKQAQLDKLREEFRQLEEIHNQSQRTADRLAMSSTRSEIAILETDQLGKKYKFIKQSYYEHGNRAGKLMAFQLKKQQADKVIPRIYDPELAKHTYDTSHINRIFHNFYSTLYGAQSPPPRQGDIDGLLEDAQLSSLSPEDVSFLGEEISGEEVYMSVAAQRSGSAPGPDGFTAEFYKAFGDSLNPLLHRVFLAVFTMDSALPSAWSEATVTVVPKPVKDRSFGAFYRPISLLNTDYKLFTKILASMHDRLLPFLIHVDHAGFVRC